MPRGIFGFLFDFFPDFSFYEFPSLIEKIQAKYQDLDYPCSGYQAFPAYVSEDHRQEFKL